MRRIDLIEFNKELMRKLSEAGIRLEDYRYCDLYESYLELSEKLKSRKAVILTLADMFHISDRQVYNILNRFERAVKPRR